MVTLLRRFVAASSATTTLPGVRTEWSFLHYCAAVSQLVEDRAGGMSLMDAQKALRRTGIGGSEVAAVSRREATRKTDDGAIKTGFDVWWRRRRG